MIQEDGTATLTGTITDPGTLDTFTLVVNWGDPLSPANQTTHTYGPSNTGTQAFQLTHQYLDDNPTDTPDDTYTINVALTDDDGATDTAGTSVTVGNVAPIVQLDSVQQRSRKMGPQPSPVRLPIREPSTRLPWS